MNRISALGELFLICLTASIPCQSFTMGYDVFVVVGQRARVFLARTVST